MTTNELASQIYNTVIQQGYSDTLAKLIIAQAEHESAVFSSDVFIRTNNPFGMTYAGQKLASVSDKPQPKKDGNSAYAAYPDVSVATLDLLAWLERKQTQGCFNISDLTDPDTYAQALKDAHYYQAPETVYENAITKFFGQMTTSYQVALQKSPIMTIGISIAAIFGGVALVYGGVVFLKNKNR